MTEANDRPRPGARGQSSASHLRWLHGELPGLIEAGILSPESARGLEAHYGQLDEGSTTRDRALLIFGILGALLIGLGIVLVFAFNWDMFSRPAKTVVSFLPLLGGQALLAYALLRRRDSSAWREASAGFLFIAIGANLGLLYQIYQIGGDLEDFLLIWLLLALPLIYLADATVPALLYLGAVMTWAAMRLGLPLPERSIFWILAGLTLPYFWWRARAVLDGSHAVLLRWAYVAVLTFGLFLTFPDISEDRWPLIFALYMGSIYLAEALWYPGKAQRPLPGLWRRPFHVVGGLALVVFAFAHSYADVWELFGGDGWFFVRAGSPLGAEERLLVGLVFSAYLLILARVAAVGRLADLGLGSLPISALLGFGLMAGGAPSDYAAWLFSLHIFAAGIWGIVQGMRQSNFGQVSSSLGLVSLLILLRFFDSELGLLARGIVFIVVGTGFLATNFILARRMRS